MTNNIGLESRSQAGRGRFRGSVCLASELGNLMKQLYQGMGGTRCYRSCFPLDSSSQSVEASVGYCRIVAFDLIALDCNRRPCQLSWLKMHGACTSQLLALLLLPRPLPLLLFPLVCVRLTTLLALYLRHQPLEFLLVRLVLGFLDLELLAGHKVCVFP